jgi:putative phosphoglycerate mutase
MRLHLIRHTTPDVPAGVCYGQSDVPLASSFATEAQEVRKRLCTLLEGNVPSRVYSSPLSRCLLLAEACGYPDPLQDDRLMELNFGAWELQRFDAITDPQLERWYADYLYEAPTGGESFHAQVLRVASFLDELRANKRGASVETENSPTGEALVFTHGGVLLGAGIWAGLFSMEEAFDHRTPYGRILTLEI